MSSFQNANWMRRLWSLAKPGDPVADFVTNVNVVNDGSYRGSRERAPYARHFGLLSAPGAGSHSVLELRGSDTLTTAQPVKLLHHLVVMESTGLLAFTLADPSGLTFGSRTAQTPIFRDRDGEITPEVNHCVMTTANLPSGGLLLPNNESILPYSVIVPCAGSWDDNRSLFIWSATDNAQLLVDAMWQVMRA